LALFANIRLGLKGLPGTKHYLITTVKSFITFGSGVEIAKESDIIFFLIARTSFLIDLPETNPVHREVKNITELKNIFEPKKF
jgi:hypothetical protein